MNIRPLEATLVVHCSGAKVERIAEVESDIFIAYDSNQKIVDVTVKARTSQFRVDLVDVTDRDKARLTYDETVDALAIDAGDSAYRDSSEVSPGFVVDYDDDGFLRGFEFLNASNFFSDQTMTNIRKRAPSR